MTNYQPFPPRRRGSLLPTLVAGAAFVLAAFLVFDRTGWLQPAPSVDPRPVVPRGDLAPLEQTFVDVFENRSPSVAHINTSSLMRTRRGNVQEKTGSGSGFVWDAAGIIVTNHHVVEGATTVQVTIDGRTHRAGVVAKSPNHDLALLKLSGPARGLVPLPLGRSDDLRVGQTAIAIGNPFGFDLTMTTGIVSALNRTIQTDTGGLMHGLIQVDAAINPGNSGGPLLDSAGRLIGVTTAIFSPNGANAGIGFAVPVDTVNEIVPRLLAGRPTAGILGVRSEYEHMRLDPGIGYESGAIVTEVLSDYGAAAAGLRAFEVSESPRGDVIERYGDVIVAIDGKPTRAFRELGRVLASRKPGDKVKVRVIRGLPNEPREMEIEVTLAAQGEGLPSGT